MAIDTPPKELEETEDLDELIDEAAAGVEDLKAEEAERAPPIARLSVAMGFAALSAAVMVGGVFAGAAPYFWTGVAGLLGVLLGNLIHRVRGLLPVMLLLTVGLFGIGLILVLFAGGPGAVFGVGPLATEAVRSGDVLRPPVQYTLGWRAITGWLMGALGFSAAWVAIELRRPAMGLLIPIPLVVIGAISVPDASKAAIGLVSVALFAIALGVLSSAQEGEESKTSLSYELRRLARAAPMIGVMLAILWGLSRFNLLFPEPLYDPTQEAQRPRTVPLSEVEDRVLFSVESAITGPWRMGLLDVYDGREWRLPPFAQTRLAEVPGSGIVNSELIAAVQATFTIKELGGAVLPGLPNTVGVVAEGPRLAYDSRTGNIRLAQGQVEEGLVYTVVAAKIPGILELQNVGPDYPRAIQQFLRVPEPPPAVQRLIERAPKTSLWDQFDFVRQEFLKTVVAKGQGEPVPVPPSRVQDMLAGSKEGSPFEIVAAQALLARWVGVPSRIGYGFDGGDAVGNIREIRPKHGAAFIEIYFTGYGWLPVLGTPKQASSALGSSPKQLSESILPSDEISLPLYIPIQFDEPGYLWAQVRRVLAIAVPAVLLLLLVYYTWPGLKKAVIRSRRRTWAVHEGPKERVALAYAEWRDFAADFGYLYPADTPLKFVDRVVPDDEHTELAWLVTRGLWGDLQEGLSDEDALIAEELSKALRKRLAQAHSATLRAVAALSRLSLRQPYAPALLTLIKRRHVEAKKAA